MSALALIDWLLSSFDDNTNVMQQHQTETDSYSIEQNEQPQNKMIRHLDEQLRLYYDENNRKDYWNEGDKQGKFAQWCAENGFGDSHLKDEFELDACDATIVIFDEDFPLNPEIEEENERDMQIFNILQYLHHDKDLLFVDQFELLVTAEQIVETRKMYEKHIKTWDFDGDFTQLSDINILYFLTVSSIGSRNNLLINLIDSYNRDIIFELIRIKKEMEEQKDKEYNLNEVQRVAKWISCRPFIKKLDQQIKYISRKLNLAEIERKITGKKQNTNKKRELSLQKLLETYPKRMGSRLRLTGRLIDDSLQMVSKCITASTTFIHQLIHHETKGIGGTPFLVDFMILLQPSIPNVEIAQINRASVIGDEDDDDDDEYDEYDNIENDSAYSSDILGNVSNYLRQNKCKLFEAKLSDITDEKNELDIELYDQIARKCIKDGFTNLRALFKGQQGGKYPHNRRVNIIIDRRDYYKDKLTLFEPPVGCNKLPNINIPEIYFDLSRQCLIPTSEYICWEKRTEKDKQYSFDSRQSVQGQLFTLSYHVQSANEVKCYLLWNGQSHRFYPQDIVQLLPHIFRKDKDNTDFAASDEAKRLIVKMSECITDPKFEMFYRGVNQWNKYRFPKTYMAQSEIS